MRKKTSIALFDYYLPEDLIAQYPAGERDASRLLVVDRASGKTDDRRFSDLADYLHEGDLLVFNDSRVIKARLIGEKEASGARIEILLTKCINKEKSIAGFAISGMEHQDNEEWEAIARPAKRLHPGDCIAFGPELRAEVVGKADGGLVNLRFECEGRFLETLEQIGHVPLPPYIRRDDEEKDAERYQTVYAKAHGSAAAPTAGLHFTENMIEKLREKGVETAFITLHVGLGTFRPVQTECIEDHRMHEEYYYISREARRQINEAKADGRRIICVGTTSVRTLESASVWDHVGNRYIPEENCVGDTDIFLYPGGRGFFMADGLITNFHLPKSTLFMLVSAFYDREKMLAIYKGAIEKRYRFFSYGDAMLIL